MEITIDEFKEQYLPSLQDEFCQKTQEYITANLKAIQNRAHDQMEMFLKIVVMFQEKFPVNVGMIQVALLNTSLYVGRPQIAFTAYDEAGYMGQELITMKRDAGWLFSEWSSYREALEKKVDELHCQQMIRTEGIRQLMWESFPYLQACLYSSTKYVFRKMEEFSQFDELLLGESFRVRTGAYMDWGMLAYAKRKETDIFFDTSIKKFRFCRFRQVVYNQKNFKEMDLSSTHFEECDFIHCRFEQVNLCDAVFENCRFYYCSFQDVEFYGATMIKSTFKKMDFQDCKFEMDLETMDIKEIKDLYKPMEMKECTWDE